MLLQGTQAVHPEFEIIRQFVVTDVYDAMSSTWFGHSRKLVSTVTSSGDIGTCFHRSLECSITQHRVVPLLQTTPGCYFPDVSALPQRRYLYAFAFVTQCFYVNCSYLPVCRPV